MIVAISTLKAYKKCVYLREIPPTKTTEIPREPIFENTGSGMIILFHKVFFIAIIMMGLSVIVIGSLQTDIRIK